MKFTKLLSILTGLCSLAGASQAAPITTPPGLNPGDTYRIIFSTTTVRNAASGVIGVYNAFVSNVANATPELAGLNTTWVVLGSTGAVNALDNAGLSAADTTTPFYNTRGELIATGVTGPGGLYDGASTAHLHAIYNEVGGATITNIWTGTFPSGETGTLTYLGVQGGNGAVANGNPGATNHFWTDGNPEPGGLEMHLFGISGNLTVPPGDLVAPAAVPEASTLAMLGGALLALGCVRRSRSHSQHVLVAGLALSFAFAAGTQASVISENLTFNAGSGSNNTAMGQSLTTPGGGPWENIQFNFYQLGAPQTLGAPFAWGTLFVLTQEYTGPVAALNAATPGFLASTNTISGGVWQFAGLTLQPNTEYYFLAGSTTTEFRLFHSDSAMDVLDGGLMYGASGANSYVPLPFQDTAFTLQGTATGVPEPGTLWLLAAGLALVVFTRFDVR